MKKCLICQTKFEDSNLDCPACGKSRYRQVFEDPETGREINDSKKSDRKLRNLKEPIFVSFEATVINAGEDSLKAAEIVKGLKRRGILVWVDPVCMAKNFTIATDITNAVLESRILIYICSKATASSIWCNIENVEFLKYLPQNRNLEVLSVLVEEASIPEGLERYRCFNMIHSDVETQLDLLSSEIKRLLNKRKIFISYSSKDKIEVRRIVRSLKEVHGLDVWFDEFSLPPGSIIRRGIERGIANADYLLAIISENSLDGEKGWIGFELDQAYERERERNLADHFFLIPVIIDENISLKGWLETKVYIDLTKDFDEGMQKVKDSVAMLSPV